MAAHLKRFIKLIVITAAAVSASALFRGHTFEQITGQDTAEHRRRLPSVPEAPEEPVSQEPKAMLALQYEMNIGLDTEKDSMNQSTVITLKNNTEETADFIYLRYNPTGLIDYCRDEFKSRLKFNKDKHAELSAVMIEGCDEPLPITFSHGGTAVLVNLDQRPVKPGETVKLTVESYTDIPDAEVKFSVVKKKPGKFYKLVFCYPYLEYNREGAWYVNPPSFRHVGENRNPDLSDYRVNVKVPDNFRIASPGTQIRKDDTITIIADGCRDFAMFASDYMGVDTFDCEGVTVHSYYLKDGASEDYRELSKQFTEDAVAGYTKLLGQLGRNEFSLVEGFNGMEYSGIVEIIGSAFYRNNPAGYLEAYKNITHEIGHLWVFDTVGNYEFSEGWIDEGFVSYLTKDEILSTYSRSYDLILERYPRGRTAEQYARDQRNEIAKMAADVKNKKTYTLLGSDSIVERTPLLDMDPGDSVYATSGAKEYFYSRVAFARLKKLMGEQEFYDFLHEFYNTFKWKITDTDDIIEIARKHCDDPDLEKQIRFWFPGAAPAPEPQEDDVNIIRQRLKKPSAAVEEAL